MILTSEYTIQNKEFGLEQEFAKQIVRLANDWLTKDDPNMQTARLEDNVRVIIELAANKLNNSTSRNLKQVIINTIVLDSGFVISLDKQLVDSILSKNCFWMNEKNTIYNPSESPEYYPQTKYYEVPKQNIFSDNYLKNSSNNFSNNFSITNITSPTLLQKIRLAIVGYKYITNNNLNLSLLSANHNEALVKCGIVSRDINKNFKWLSFGGVRFMNPNELRIALGENLMYEILLTQNQQSSFSPNNELEFDLENNYYQYQIKLFSGAEYRFNELYKGVISLNTFGFNNSGLSSENINLGLGSKNLSVGLLLPFPFWNNDIGIYKKRILTPTLGINLVSNYQAFSFYGKYAPLSFPKDSFEISNKLNLAATLAILQNENYQLLIGAGFSNYVAISKAQNEFTETKFENKFYPIIDFKYSYSSNTLFFINTYKYSICAGFSTWLTENFGIETLLEHNNILKSKPIYEHNYMLFITPMFRL